MLVQPLRMATECEVDLVRRRPGCAIGLRPWIPKHPLEFYSCATEPYPCPEPLHVRPAQRSLALRPAHLRRHLYVTCYTEGFSHFVTSMTAPVASGWSDLAGWGSHPLESAALSRRTRRADI